MRTPKSRRISMGAALSLALTLGACAVELGGPAPAASLAAPLAPSVPAFAPSPTREATPAEPRREREPRSRDKGPSNGRFVAAHFGAGVAGTMVIQTMTYALARSLAQRGQGLAPVIGALALGAFAPPILNYTIQWAFGRTVAPRRDRFWPGFLVRQAVHLGVFVGAVMGGADFNKPGHFAAIVVGEAFVNSGLASMTAELARRPLAPSPSAARLPGPRPVEIVVPIVEVKF